MNLSTFNADPAVIDFSDWLASKAHSIKIDLEIRKSRFVPAKIRKSAHGFDQVLSLYQWAGDWPQTCATLAGLSSNLKTAVASGNEATTLKACKDILAWGGNRSFSVGAYPFLDDLHKKSQLCDYIRATGSAFILASANTASIAPPVTRMNSMLTKVHALYADDGLPIYDSRVAAAIASLVELWRDMNGLCSNGLPQALIFPATLPTRTVTRLFPCAQNPGVMAYGASGTAAEWSGAKIRLGWLLQLVLSKNPSLFKHMASMPEKMRAFEACLFMIGYDVMCLDHPRAPGRHQTDLRRSKSTKIPEARSETPSAETPKRTIGTLKTPDEGAIIYTGSIESGIRFEWGKMRWIELTPEQIEDIQAEFSGSANVPLGASENLPRPVDSFGQWLEDNGWSSARWASAIAAILHEEGIISGITGKKPIHLTFA